MSNACKLSTISGAEGAVSFVVFFITFSIFSSDRIDDIINKDCKLRIFVRHSLNDYSQWVIHFGSNEACQVQSSEPY